jgi:hypothetical protein
MVGSGFIRLIFLRAGYNKYSSIFQDKEWKNLTFKVFDAPFPGTSRPYIVRLFSRKKKTKKIF